MGAIDKINLFKPIMPLNPTEGVGAGGGAKRVQPTGEQGYNPFAAISRIDGEKTPTYGAQDSTYTNGLGHSDHKFMYFA
ncbi:hypothetical protein IJ750_03415 [bacterium]|nr:hypothetical protein [bacterium]